LKKCAECGREMTVNLLFCTTCGTKVDVPSAVRRARILFFISPFFFILIGVGISFDLGMIRPADSGIAFGGIFALIYLFSAAVFWLMASVLKFPVLPESYWQAGLYSVLQFIACSLFAYSVDQILTGEFPAHIGPWQINQNRVEFILLALLPTWFTGFFLVSARARFTRFPIASHKPLVKFVLQHGPALQPLMFIVIATMIFYAQPTASQFFIKARLMQDLEVPLRALRTLEDGLELLGEHPALLYLKGEIILDSMPGEYTPAMARQALERAVAMRGDIPIYQFRLSMAYDLEKMPEKAVEAASAAISLLPGDYFLYQHMGDLMLKYKQLPEAVEAFRKSLKLNPDNALLLNNLAYTLLELDKDLPEALQMARRSVQMLPGLVFNLDTLAWAFYKNRQFAEALEVMSTIYQGRSEVSPEVDFHYAMILSSVGALKDPLQTMDLLLARPEVAVDQSLFRQIYEARAKFAAEPEPDVKSGQKPENDDSKTGDEENAEK